MWQNERSYEQEILDLGPNYYTQKEYTRCLQLLARVNHLLGGFRATRKVFNTLEKKPQSILEIGCGGGYLCHFLHRHFPYAKIKGIDISPEAVDHAQNSLPGIFKDNISFNVQKDKTLDYPDNSFDVVTTMLVCHHMTDKELVFFLKESSRIASHAVIINDLHRHLLGYLSYSLITPFLFPNRLLWHDGRLSVRRAFRKQDWVALLEKAGFQKEQYVLRWHWAFRWTLTIMSK